MSATTWQRRVLKPAVFLLCAVPLLLLVSDAVRGELEAEPIKDITHRTGFWGLTILVATVAVTPLRRISGWNGIVRLRRMLGLWGFTYIASHFLIYLVLDQFFAWEFIIEDIAERPYITVGFASFVLLVPLAVTSTKGMIRRLGKRWGSLHRLVYIATAGGVIHFLWSVKADTRRPTVYGLVLVVLLAVRLVPKWTGRRRRTLAEGGSHVSVSSG